ncbi:hypothetical protein SAMN06265347_13015, partial [Halobellus salinus]
MDAVARSGRTPRVATHVNLPPSRGSASRPTVETREERRREGATPTPRPGRPGLRGVPRLGRCRREEGVQKSLSANPAAVLRFRPEAAFTERGRASRRGDSRGRAPETAENDVSAVLGGGTKTPRVSVINPSEGRDRLERRRRPRTEGRAVRGVGFTVYRDVVGVEEEQPRRRCGAEAVRGAVVVLTVDRANRSHTSVDRTSQFCGNSCVGSLTRH